MPDHESVNAHSQEAADGYGRSNAEVAGVLGDAWLTLVRLCRIEMQGSLREVSTLIQLGLMRVPALLLLWCSFSALISWWVYELSDRALLGFATLFVLQGMLVTGIHLLSARSLHLMSLPHTREYANRLLAILEKDGRRESRE